MGIKDQDPDKKITSSQLKDLVIESDIGGRRVKGIPLKVICVVAFVWSLFHLWIASPLMYSIVDWQLMDYLSIDPRTFYINSKKEKYIHLSFAMFLAFLAYPAFARSARSYIPMVDWILACGSATSCLYLFYYYDEIAMSMGVPTKPDLIVASIGVFCLLEISRRVLGLPLVIFVLLLALYCLFGDSELLPIMIRNRRIQIGELLNQYWLTDQGIFGIALGVSADFVFLFVVFGVLLEKVGAGSYFIHLSYSLVGHMRGGAAKAAVFASGMTGLVSGSSIANVVTTGVFTIPIMIRSNISKENASALEVASSVNGQLMPPVMGAAVFFMVEYVGISYTQVIQHAFLPAIISYLALIYIVHLEAIKANTPFVKRKNHPTSVKLRIVRNLIVISGTFIFLSLAYYVVYGIKNYLSNNTYILVIFLLGCYFLVLRLQAKDFVDLNKEPELLMDMSFFKIFKSGMHHIFPIIVLVWCLGVRGFSPSSAAFFAIMTIMFILLTQDFLRHYLARDHNYKQPDFRKLKQGLFDIFDGLVVGARNMVAIGIATAIAGIIVGSVILTGVGQMLGDFVDYISYGSMFLVLVYTAIMCIILGMGLPTTANYILVSNLMVSVVLSLADKNGLAIPLIAVHLFVFYFGIMADVTPPVGLASIVAAAISGGKTVKTGIKAFVYSLRTIILPFVFIYNNDLLLIDIQLDTVSGFLWMLFVFAVNLLGVLLISSVIQNYLLCQNKWYESVALILIAFMFLLPNRYISLFQDKYVTFQVHSLKELSELVANADMNEEQEIKVLIKGKDRYENDRNIKLRFQYSKDIIADLKQYGLVLADRNNKVVVQEVIYFSKAMKLDIDTMLSQYMEFDYVLSEISLEQKRIHKSLVYIIAVLLLALLLLYQNRRRKLVR